MSPQYRQADASPCTSRGRASPRRSRACWSTLEAALAPFGARPHWGKAFRATAAEIAPLYERLPDFARLAQRLDPRGAFRNDWLERHVLGGGPLSLGGQARARREPVARAAPAARRPRAPRPRAAGMPWRRRTSTAAAQARGASAGLMGVGGDDRRAARRSTSSSAAARAPAPW